MNSKETVQFVNWMEEKCKALNEGENFVIPEKWVCFPIVKAFRAAYNKQNPNKKVAAIKKGNCYEILGIPAGTNISIYEGTTSRTKASKKDNKQECFDRIDKAIEDYFNGEINEQYVRYFKNVDLLISKKVIPYNYIRMKVVSNSCFKNQAKAEGMKRTTYFRVLLSELIKNKVLLQIPILEGKEEFETEAELYVYIKE